jgi:hypothetical protein
LSPHFTLPSPLSPRLHTFCHTTFSCLPRAPARRLQLLVLPSRTHRGGDRLAFPSRHPPAPAACSGAGAGAATLIRERSAPCTASAAAGPVVASRDDTRRRPQKSLAKTGPPVGRGSLTLVHYPSLQGYRLLAVGPGSLTLTVRTWRRPAACRWSPPVSVPPATALRRSRAHSPTHPRTHDARTPTRTRTGTPTALFAPAVTHGYCSSRRAPLFRPPSPSRPLCTPALWTSHHRPPLKRSERVTQGLCPNARRPPIARRLSPAATLILRPLHPHPSCTPPRLQLLVLHPPKSSCLKASPNYNQ